MFFAGFIVLILFKLSYSHSQSTNSNYLASNYFNSGHSRQFASNYFDSNFFYACNSKNLVSSSSMNYLTMVLSIKQNSVHQHYSLSSMNYLTMVLSLKQNSVHHHYSLSAPSLIPSPSPSLIPSPSPSLIPSPSPSLIPTPSPSLISSPSPSLISSPSPSFSPDQPLLTFESSMYLSGLTKPELDNSAQQAIIIATSKSMNVSLNFVKFISQKMATTIVAIQSFHIFLQSPTYTIVAVTEITIPLSQYDNPTLLYSSLKTKLLESVGNGNFNTFLVAASIALNSTSTQNAVLLGIEMTDPIQDLKLDSSKKYDAKYLRIFLIVVFSLIGIIVFGIFSIVFRKKCRMNRRNQIELIQLIELNQIQITE
jgi:hypothetical protein